MSTLGHTGCTVQYSISESRGISVFLGHTVARSGIPNVPYLVRLCDKLRRVTQLFGFFRRALPKMIRSFAAYSIVSLNAYIKIKLGTPIGHRIRATRFHIHTIRLTRLSHPSCDLHCSHHDSLYVASAEDCAKSEI